MFSLDSTHAKTNSVLIPPPPPPPPPPLEPQWLPVVVTARMSLSSCGTILMVTDVDGPMAGLALISISQGLKVTVL